MKNAKQRITDQKAKSLEDCVQATKSTTGGTGSASSNCAVVRVPEFKRKRATAAKEPSAKPPLGETEDVEEHKGSDSEEESAVMSLFGSKAV